MAISEGKNCMPVKNDPQFTLGEYSKAIDRKHPTIKGLRYKVEWTNASGLHIPLCCPRVWIGWRPWSALTNKESRPIIADQKAFEAMISFCERYETVEEVNDFILRLLTKKVFFINVKIEVYADLKTVLPVLGKTGSKIFGYSEIDSIETSLTPKKYCQTNPEVDTLECLDTLLASATIDYRSSVDGLIKDLRTTIGQVQHLASPVDKQGYYSPLFPLIKKGSE